MESKEKLFYCLDSNDKLAKVQHFKWSHSTHMLVLASSNTGLKTYRFAFFSLFFLMCFFCWFFFCFLFFSPPQRSLPQGEGSRVSSESPFGDALLLRQTFLR